MGVNSRRANARLSFELAHSPGGLQEGQRTFGIRELIGPHHVEGLAERHGDKLDQFVVVEIAFSGLKVEGGKQVYAFIGEARCGQDAPQAFKAPRFFPRLFFKLSDRTGFWRLSWIEFSSRDLMDVASRRIAVLADQKHFVVGEKGDDGRSPGVSNQIQGGPSSTRQFNLFRDHFQHGARLFSTFGHAGTPSTAEASNRVGGPSLLGRANLSPQTGGPIFIMPRAFERSVILPLPEEAGAPDHVLEGLYVPSPEPGESALIAPPHPQMGGSMESPVLTDIAWACQEAEVASLRFNWRGVGASSGRPSGDAADADVDFKAGLAFLAETVPGPRAACGYSFGAVTALRAALSEPGIQRLVLAAPPTSLLPEAALAEFRGSVFVVAGDRDEWVDLDRLTSLLDAAPAAHLEVIEDCDHFFMSALGRLGRSLADWWRES